MLDLSSYEGKIKELCAALGLKKLALFGSATTAAFRPESDVDVLVEFNTREDDNLFETYFKLKEELEGIFHRPVDIVVDASIKNPFLRKTVDSTKKTIYVG
jgi:uncharacterized protein